MKIKSSVYQSLFSVFLLICVIVACTPLSPQPHPKPDAPSTLTQVIPTATDTQIIPTATEIIPTATEVPAYIVQDPTETFTTAQDKLNKSPEALSQQQRLQRWLDYWVKFDNRPFALDSADIHWKYIYDNPKNRGFLNTAEYCKKLS